MNKKCISLMAIMVTLISLSFILSCDLADNKPPFTPGSPVAERVASDTLMYDLGWSCSDPDSDPLMYNIHFGTSDNPPLITSQAQNHFRTPVLVSVTTYYWKIDALDNHHNQTSSPVWQFVTPSE
jgi:hypothetical protein